MSQLARFIRTLFGKLFRRPLIDIEMDLAPEAEASLHYPSIMTLDEARAEYYGNKIGQ